VHVPCCASRSGFWHFNTYSLAELGGANPDGWLTAVRAELALAAVRPATAPTADTVFVGGAHPPVLDGAQLAAAHNTFGLSHGAEITTEANPKPTSPELLDGLLVAGYTPGVAGHADRASGARGAGSGAFTRPGGGRRPRSQAAGFNHPNLDLIYGTPEGERRRPDAFGRRGRPSNSGYQRVPANGGRSWPASTCGSAARSLVQKRSDLGRATLATLA
jgi:hypothetical protein